MTQVGTNNNKACPRHWKNCCCFTLSSWSDSLCLPGPVSLSVWRNWSSFTTIWWFLFWWRALSACREHHRRNTNVREEEEKAIKDGSVISLPQPVCLQLSGLMSYTIMEMEGPEQISHGLSIFWWAVSTDWFQRVGQEMTGWSAQMQLEVKLQVCSQLDSPGNMR